MSPELRQPDIPPDRVFDFLQKFNRIVTLDEELGRQLPSRELELSFDKAGSIYVDGKSLGVNVQRRYRALRQLVMVGGRPETLRVLLWSMWAATTSRSYESSFVV